MNWYYINHNKKLQEFQNYLLSVTGTTGKEMKGKQGLYTCYDDKKIRWDLGITHCGKPRSAGKRLRRTGLRYSDFQKLPGGLIIN
jgi:hypothetical protein